MGQKEKLSSAMIEVLSAIVVEPRRTHRRTEHQWVSGAAAAALCRRGLAKRVYDHSPLEPGQLWNFEFKVEITDQGRKVLASIKS